MSIQMQHCGKCGEDKPLTVTFWHKNKSNRNGFARLCKRCKSFSDKKYLISEKGAAKTREYLVTGRKSFWAAKYERSEHGKRWRKAYRKTEKGKIIYYKAKQKYEQCAISILNDYYVRKLLNKAGIKVSKNTMDIKRAIVALNRVTKNIAERMSVGNESYSGKN